MVFFPTLLLSLFITIALIPVFARLAVRLQAVDVPDGVRKIHTQPVPRTGGIAMVLGAFIPVIFWIPLGSFVRAILIGVAILGMIGLVDDFSRLGYRAKFAGQIAAALVMVFYGGVKIEYLGALLPENVLVPTWVSIPLTVLVIVGVTNAINLSDGLDGLAGGICLLCFSCIGYLGYLADNSTVTLLAVAVVGAIFGFLRFNTYPATLFMGDTGSQFLGFLAASLSLALTQGNQLFSALLPLIILGFPVLDTMAVMLERVTEGRSPFMPDRNHFHHKLIRLGFYHSEAVVIIYVLQAFLVTSAFIFRFHSEWVLMIEYLVFSSLILATFYLAGRTGWRFKRTDLLDEVIKGKLRELRERGVVIKACFRVVKIGLPSLIFLICLVPSKVPEYTAWIALSLVGVVGASWFFKTEWLGGSLRLALYLSIPLVVYLGEVSPAVWSDGRLMQLYHLSFGALVLFVILTLRFTRRKRGFRSTPMDFLILFIALVVPNLPDEQIRSYHMGLVAAEIVMVFFSYEVLLGELRGELKKVSVVTMCALGLIVVRGVVG